MKVKIVLSTFNRPDLLSLQIRLIHKYLKNDHDIIVLHDSRDNQYVDDFLKICDLFNVPFYHHDSISGKTPSQYHGESVQWIYDTLINKEFSDNLVLILDHDMFLIDNLDLVEYIGDSDIVGCHQQRGSVEYIWPGLVMFRSSSVENIEFDFLPTIYNGQSLDTGGGTYKILESDNIKYKPIDCVYPDTYMDINLQDVDDGYGFELYLDQSFLHFRNASSWHNNYTLFENSKKNEVLNLILDSFLDSSDILMKEYHTFSLTRSEINEHLPTLYTLAKQCDSVVELGVCHGKSTRALLASGTKLRSYDVWIDSKVLELFEHAKNIGNDVDYIRKNSVHTEIEECDMLFIDTWHNYYQLRKELKLHADKVKKYIVFHDTVSCGSVGEDWKSWGNGSKIQYEQLCNDLDTDAIDSTGINSAIFEFLSEHPEWRIKIHYKNNNGLTIIEKHG